VFSAADRIWFAPAHGGLYWFREGHVGSVAALRDDVIYSIAGAPDGVVVGRQHGGITHVRARGDTFASETVTERGGLAQDPVFAVQGGGDGAMWGGTLNRGVSRLKDGEIDTYTTADGLASNTVASILQTADGDIWIATPSGLSVKKAAGWHRYSTAEGL